MKKNFRTKEEYIDAATQLANQIIIESLIFILIKYIIYFLLLR